MRAVTTLILLTIATGLGVWIYLDESRYGPGRAIQDGDSKVLTRFQPEAVTEIRIGFDGVETVIAKHDGLWFFEKPVADRADQDTTAAVLDLLSHLRIRDKISSEEIKTDDSLSDQQLGFSEKDVIRATLILDADNKKKDPTRSEDKVVLIFGKITPMVNTIFARLDSETKESDSVYIVDGNPRKYFEDPAAALRDQTLLFTPADQLVSLTVRTARDTIKLKRKPTAPTEGWLMVSPLLARANSELIEMIIARLSSLRVDSLLDTKGASGANPNPVPENGVVFELQMLGMEKPVSVFLSPAKASASVNADKKATPLLKARTSDRPATFLVRSSLLEQVPQSSKAFRDPFLARIPIQLLNSIIIQTRNNPNVILTAMPPTDGRIQWRSNRNGKREEANLAKIIRLVSAVNEEKILDFVADSKTDPATYGLDRPFTAITFNVFQPVPQTADPQAGDTQEPKLIQRTLRLGFGKDDANRMFANFVDEPYIYQISPAFRNRVSPHPLKWKAPKVLSFSLLSLRQIERKKKDQTPLRMDYDYIRNQWAGQENGTDISAKIDNRGATKLASTLGSLTAQDWITTSQLAYQALNDPSLTFTIVIEEIDHAIQEPRNVSHTLKFAPASTGFHYGSLDNSPDVFIIDSKTYRNLVQPVIASPAALRPGQ